jgi:hypothetical protein
MICDGVAMLDARVTAADDACVCVLACVGAIVMALMWCGAVAGAWVQVMARGRGEWCRAGSSMIGLCVVVASVS